MIPAEAASVNLATHFTWVQRQTPGMRVSLSPDLTLTDCGMPCDTFNAACRARLTRSGAAAGVRAALRWFGETGHPFSWWLGPGDEPSQLGRLLSDAGLVAAETELAMAAPLAGLSAVNLSPGGLSIVRVRTLEDLRAFAGLSAANWSPPDLMVERFYEAGAPVLLQPDAPLRYYLGFVDGIPVATAELAVAGGVVGLYSISTREPYRGRGFGTAMTAWPLLEAREEGFETAILQAAAEGVGVYRRLGFRSFGEITEYKPPR